MKILLVTPGNFDDIDNRVIREISFFGAEAFFAPHAVTAVAALTPPNHQVTIHDENVRGPVEAILANSTFDIIGISITSNQLKRSLAISAAIRLHCPKTLVVVGGIGVEHLIQENENSIDVVFQGEVESTWAQFLEDFAAGCHKASYRSATKPDMRLAPAPRWELLGADIHKYNAVSVQTTRGCPFDCSFCDVIYTYGRKPRSKTIDQVLEEIQRLHDLKVRMVFLADDNFAGDKRYTKELLQRLIPLNNSFDMPLGFLTQLDITVAEDPHLLEMLADANFFCVMVGVESINEDSLKDMNKLQNIRRPIKESIDIIQSYGIVVLAHMIIGADSDDATVFEKTANFVNEANIVQHICHPLTAPPGTRLWYDLKRQGRVVNLKLDEAADKLDIISNIMPKQLSRVQLFEGLADYWDQIYDTELFRKRAMGFLKNIKRKPKVRAPRPKAMWEMRHLMNRIFKYAFTKAPKARRQMFMEMLMYAGPRLSYLMPKILYLFTSLIMDEKRSSIDAAIAREHAQWERNHPEAIQLESSEIPIAQTIRTDSVALCRLTWDTLRHAMTDRSAMYTVAVAVLAEFNDRFGSTYRGLSDVEKENLIATCERHIAALAATSGTAEAFDAEPPAGFAREIIDTLDKKVRHQNRVAVAS